MNELFDEGTVTRLANTIRSEPTHSPVRSEAAYRLIDRERETIREHLARFSMPASDLNDIVNEAFLRVRADALNYQPGGNFRALFRQTVKHMLIDRIRERERRPGDFGRGSDENQAALDGVADRATDSVADSVAVIFDLIREKYFDEAFEAALAASRAPREVIAAAIYGGRKLKEIAESLGLKISAVYEAKRRFKAALENYLLRTLPQADAVRLLRTRAG